MADVFISYSRNDSVFARRLVQALVDIGQETWVDWSSISYSEDWWQEICTGIDSADNFLFIISPDSLTSMMCNKELAYARAHNKRIIPILHREVLSGGKPLAKITTVWYAEEWEQIARDNLDELQRLHWLFFRGEDDFSEWFNKLITTAKQEPEHVKMHTRFLLWAREWERQRRNPANLLRGDDLTSAETWLTTAEEKDPSPHDLHREYIAESRHEEDEIAAESARRESLIQRFRLATGVLLVMGVLAVITAIVALAASQQALADIAQARKEQEIADLQARSNLRLAEGNRYDAIRTAEQLVELYPDEARAFRARGVIYRFLGDIEQAITDYTRAIELDSQNATAYNNRGNAYANQKRYTAAITDYTRAIELDPDYASAYYNRGNAYCNQGRYTAAIADYTRAIELDPDYASAYYNRGIAYDSQGRYVEADNDYIRAIELDPQLADLQHVCDILWDDVEEDEEEAG